VPRNGGLSIDEVRQRVLANMCFNMGITRLLKFRNMLGAIQLKNWDRAADEMVNSPWYTQVGARAVRLVQAMRTGVMP
jgi:lysozyme